MAEATKTHISGEKMTNDTVSFAMREGAKLRPQSYNKLFSSLFGEFHSCAIGAVCEYRGAIPSDKFSLQDVSKYVQIDNSPIDNPISAVTNVPANLYEVITLMNDALSWSRERIADFVETIENNSEFVITDDEDAQIKRYFSDWGYRLT